MRHGMLLLALCAIGAILFGGGCSTSSEVATWPELREQQDKGPIQVLTVDTLLYRLESFTFTDSLLSGRGVLKRERAEIPFQGSIPFRRIAFIEGLGSSGWKAVWVIPMVAGIAGGLEQMLGKPEKFEIYYRTSGSCPFVYSFDGAAFRLEAEAFGTSISKALEATTFSILPSLAPTDDRLMVRVGNERPETHLLNSAQLLVADAGGASSAVLDLHNVLWPLQRPVPPASAVGHAGANILPDLLSKDHRYWKSDLAETAPFSGFQDHLELEFDVPAGAAEATLVIDAVNTELINEVYRTMGAYLGDATLQFYHSLEHDPELQRSVRRWIEECGLRVEIADGSQWKQAGVLPPEANVAPFSRAVRLTGLRGLEGRLRVRLSTLTDVWRIDAVAIDAAPVQPLPLRPLEALSAAASDGQRALGAVASDDTSYAMILPSQHLDLSFDATPALGMRRPTYVFAARGYLYEWFPAPPDRAAPLLADAMTRTDRIATLKLLITQKDLFLPPIYAAWRNARAK